MILAVEKPGEFLMSHVTDHPWPGCSVNIGGMEITWMSSAIASMLIVGVVLCFLLPRLARKVRIGKTVGVGKTAGFLEVIVLFVRDQIATPALGRKAYTFLPMLLTLFVFVLGMNLIGLFPLEPLCRVIPGNHYLVGTTPTSVLTVCAALGGLTLCTIFIMGLWRSAQRQRKTKGWPMIFCLVSSPVTWFVSLSPNLPGVIGKILLIPLAALEFVGAIAKCFALMVRIFANMMAGHFLLAVMMMFVVQTVLASYETILNPALENKIHAFYIAPVCIIASVLVDLMELLVAGLQAYIYTFLTAMFLGLYVEHSMDEKQAIGTRD